MLFFGNMRLYAVYVNSVCVSLFTIYICHYIVFTCNRVFVWVCVCADSRVVLRLFINYNPYTKFWHSLCSTV